VYSTRSSDDITEHRASPPNRRSPSLHAAGSHARRRDPEVAKKCCWCVGDGPDRQIPPAYRPTGADMAVNGRGGPRRCGQEPHQQDHAKRGRRHTQATTRPLDKTTAGTGRGEGGTGRTSGGSESGMREAGYANSEPPAASPAAPGRCRPAAGAAATGRHHDVWRHRKKEEMQQAGAWGEAVRGTGRPRGKEGRSSTALTSGRPGPARQRRWRRRRRRRRQQRWRCRERHRGGPRGAHPGGGCWAGSGHAPHRHCQGRRTPALSVVPWRPCTQSGAVTLCEVRLCWTNQIVDVTLGSTLTGPSQGCNFPSWGRRRRGLPMDFPWPLGQGAIRV